MKVFEATDAVFTGKILPTDEHIAHEAIRRVPRLGPAGQKAAAALKKHLVEHGRYIRLHGEDMPMVREWKWRFRERS